MPLISVLPDLQPLLLAFAAVFSKLQQRHGCESLIWRISAGQVERLLRRFADQAAGA